MPGTSDILETVRTILEVMDDSVLVTTADLDAPGPVIVFVNDAFCRLSGYAPNEILGKTVRLLQGPRTSSDILRRLRQDLDTKQVFFGDMVNRRKDGSEFVVKCQIVPLHDDTGAIRHWLSIQRDATELSTARMGRGVVEHRYRQLAENQPDPISEHKKAEQVLRQKNLLLASIGRAQSRYLVEHSERNAFERLLEDLVAITESEYGIIGEVLHTAEGRPYLRTSAATDDAWNSQMRAEFGGGAPRQMEFYNPDTLIGHTMNGRSAVIANDPGGDTRSGGLPHGHPDIRAFLGLPFVVGDDIVGMAGFANRRGGYDQDLVDFLDPLTRTCAQLIQALRNDRKQKEVEEALKKSTRQQTAILNNIPDIAWLKDQDSRLIAVNEAFGRMCGVAPESVVGRTDLDIWPAELADAYRVDDRVVMRTRRCKRVEDRIVDGDGNVIWMETIKAPVVNDDGRVIGITGIARDVTARRRVERALFHEKERALVTLHSIADAVITTDAGGIVESLNPVAELLTGWTNREARGQPLKTVFQVVDEQTRDPVGDPVARCLGDPVARTVGAGEFDELADRSVLINRGGREFAIEDTAAPIRDRDGSILGLVLVFRDVTGSRRMNRQMAHDASHDPLTDLVNRREFERRLARGLAGAKKYGSTHALCYLDLDQFKLVNDVAGHAAGDALLKQIRALLVGKFRHRDTLARLGGDEFALFLENCSAGRAKKICEMIVSTLRDHRFSWQGSVYHVGVSIGVTEVTAEADTAAATDDPGRHGLLRRQGTRPQPGPRLPPRRRRAAGKPCPDPPRGDAARLRR